VSVFKTRVIVWQFHNATALPGTKPYGYAVGMASEEHVGVQAGIFDKADQVLPGGVIYRHIFLEREEADKLFEAFLKLNWQRHVYRRSGPAPRMYVWMGIPYRSPNLENELTVTDWTPEALHVKARVEEALHCAFDSLNFNLYSNEHHSIGWHPDGEAEGLWSFPIASVSLGAVRRFEWRKNSNGETHALELGHGSLLIMPPWFQRDYVHRVPKQSKPCGARINLTFRHKGKP
jgi:alkylated DNA repair dioxygenase AlkB